MAYVEDKYIEQAISDFDSIKSAIEEKGVEVPYDTDTAEYGNLIRSIIGGEDNTQTYLLLTEDGREIPAVLVDEVTIFDATANDIREGKTAATESGVTLGEKVIPSYHTIESVQVVRAEKKVEITILKERELYKYTKLQAVLCEFNTNLSDSVAVSKVAINDNVYEVQSVIPLATITVNDTDKTVDFGITNDTGKPMILRFFTYKEIE